MAYPQGARFADEESGRLTLHSVLALPPLKIMLEAIAQLVQAYPDFISMVDPETKLLQLMLAAADKKRTRYDRPVLAMIFVLLAVGPAAVSGGIPMANHHEIHLERRNRQLCQQLTSARAQTAFLQAKNVGLRSSIPKLENTFAELQAQIQMPPP